jgi:hypothetical protein
LEQQQPIIAFAAARQMKHQRLFIAFAASQLEEQRLSMRGRRTSVE